MESLFSDTEQAMKKISLVTLSIQNSALILLMRYSRISAGPMYFASCAVFFAEIFKFMACLVVISCTKSKGIVHAIENIFRGDAWKLSIPAVLYSIQNNLQFYAVSNLVGSLF
jgi:UDP-sugar transporter A1/2/3